ncbi:MAG: sugar transferase [Candidatus Omnitrophica bacterium]|nr:sugar transferase [Candidatus Omnitrophota bacterium]
MNEESRVPTEPIRATAHTSLSIAASYLLVLTDLIIFVFSFVLAFALIHETFGPGDIHWFAGFNFNPPASTGQSFIWKGMPTPMWNDFYPYVTGILIPLPIIRFLVMSRLQLYRIRGEISLLEDAIETFRGVTIGSILLIVVAFSLGGGRGETQLLTSRRVFPVDWMICMVGCIGSRALFRTAQKGARRAGHNLAPVILVGRGKQAEMIHDEIRNNPVLGYRIVHVVDADGGDPDLEKHLATLPGLIAETGAQEVFFASSKITQKELFPVVMNSGWDVQFKAVPDLLGLRPKKVDITRLSNVPLLEIFVDPLRGANGAMKRVLDLTVALSALVLLAIPMLVIAIWIKIDSKGPAIFKQTRMGLDFRPFPFFKFRSMRTDVDHKRHEEFMKQVIQFGEGKVDEQTGKKIFKEADDPRITRIGKFIRKYSIDELPQIFNVIRGEMSIVGPRPPVPTRWPCTVSTTCPGSRSNPASPEFGR